MLNCTVTGYTNILKSITIIFTLIDVDHQYKKKRSTASITLHKSFMTEGLRAEKEVKKGRHYLVDGQHSCPLKATALDKLQVQDHLNFSLSYGRRLK